ncbi:hypothetical protein CDAR_550411 [Caerostris darwini]|uniref:Uncharacterized protein n=1 Tax=Caerostris darwini TaxID=1538125 RepID=A0AAV4X8U4_9ARAC|nr:hypothetical protein CDAR_550411 [Caerostris darwini]
MKESSSRAAWSLNEVYSRPPWFISFCRCTREVGLRLSKGWDAWLQTLIYRVIDTRRYLPFFKRGLLVYSAYVLDWWKNFFVFEQIQNRDVQNFKVSFKSRRSETSRHQRPNRDDQK